MVNRLSSIAFYRRLENLRSTAFALPTDAVAVKILQEFIHYAHTFYTYFVEGYMLEAFAANQLECLSDLARYRMVVAAMPGATLSGWSLMAISRVAAGSASPKPPATARAKIAEPVTAAVCIAAEGDGRRRERRRRRECALRVGPNGWP
jgi:hypothetical protein